MPFRPFPDEPTVPILAEQTQPTWVEVVFSRDVVVDAGADPAIWTVANGGGAVVIAVEQGPAADRVRLVMSAGAGCTAVSYAPPPFDVVDALGIDVEGFADFPIT